MPTPRTAGAPASTKAAGSARRDRPYPPPSEPIASLDTNERRRHSSEESRRYVRPTIPLAAPASRQPLSAWTENNQDSSCRPQSPAPPPFFRSTSSFRHLLAQ